MQPHTKQPPWHSHAPHLGCAAARGNTNQQAYGALRAQSCKLWLAAATGKPKLLLGGAAAPAAVVLRASGQRVCGTSQMALVE